MREPTTFASFRPVLQVDLGKAFADVRETGRDFERLPAGCCVQASYRRGAVGFSRAV